MWIAIFGHLVEHTNYVITQREIIKLLQYYDYDSDKFFLIYLILS